MGIYEVLEVTEMVQKMIVGHATADDIQMQAIRDGMLTMQQDGFVKALMGKTTIEEILRVTRSNRPWPHLPTVHAIKPALFKRQFIRTRPGRRYRRISRERPHSDPR